MRKSSEKARYRVMLASEKIKAAFFPSAAEMFLPGLLHRVKEIDGLRFEAHFEDPGVAGFAALAADYDIVLAHSVDGPEVFARQGLQVIPLIDEPLDVVNPQFFKAPLAPRVAASMDASSSSHCALAISSIR